MKFPFCSQLDLADCGPACLRMISLFYGKDYPLDFFRKRCFITKEGVSLTAIAESAEIVGFNSLMIEIKLEDLIKNAPLPAILHWNKEHFVVLYDIKLSRNGDVKKISLADPAMGLRNVSYETFLSSWISNPAKNKGIALLLEPTEEFYRKELDKESTNIPSRNNLKFSLRYFVKYKRYFAQLVLAMFCASTISLLFPFLTQSIVDIGIESKDSNFVLLILLFQVFLFLSSTAIELIQNQLLLHISTRINVSIITDFLSKLMRLPIRFFDSRNIGDIINRINDQKRIEAFITSTVLRTVFGCINFLAFTIVLATYDTLIMVVFMLGSAATFGWTLLFMEKRRTLDYKLFNSISRYNENVYELVNGMQEIKLNHFELYKKWQWQKHQAKLFKINISTLKMEQYQSIGSVFFTQLKNILITFIAATAVIRGEITLGVMLSISYIIGQLNAPIEQFISFFRLYQYAKISSERMQEVFDEKDEESPENKTPEIAIAAPGIISANGTLALDEQSAIIKIRDLSFSYGNPKESLVLNNISMDIPMGQVTAIVGASGSGKSTLIKLLLKFYEPHAGQILINESNLNDVSAKWWRQNCGIVMQEGFLFSDTIERNIITGQEIDHDWLEQVCKIACIDKMIRNQPFGLQTRIGNNGIGLSGGEKQRILIARAIYKRPEFLFLDEAISSLDAKNEKAITENLNEIYINKTVVIVAHRLSTVKHADQIIVLNNGCIVEQGFHDLLVAQRGYYYELVRNQLELEK